MNTDIYSLIHRVVYMQFKTLYSRVDEVGELMLSHKIIHVATYTSIGYPIIVYQCYTPKFLHYGILGGAQGHKQP